ncbi:MAG: hypothetical protein LUD19_01925 [Clostridia bacterium]|nr:hypothetical protein [Clostridia bacterium]
MSEEKFNYSYSAPTENERKEIESIRRGYLPQEKSYSKLERLRRLDKKVKTPATAVAVILGVVGVLVFGLGLTVVLKWALYVWGSIVAALGVVLMVAAYPAFNLILKRNKAKYGQEIIELSKELLGDDK